MAAEKDRAGMADARQEPLGLGERQLQMLRRHRIDHRCGIVEMAHQHDRAMSLPAGARDFGARKQSEQTLRFRRHSVGEAGVVGDEDGLSLRIMLGLREQVGGDPIGPAAAIGHHQDLRWAGDRVDSDAAEDLPLGRGHISVAGP